MCLLHKLIASGLPSVLSSRYTFNRDLVRRKTRQSGRLALRKPLTNHDKRSFYIDPVTCLTICVLKWDMSVMEMSSSGPWRNGRYEMFNLAQAANVICAFISCVCHLLFVCSSHCFNVHFLSVFTVSPGINAVSTSSVLRI